MRPFAAPGREDLSGMVVTAKPSILNDFNVEI
jgi:hypothetical protein